VSQGEQVYRVNLTAHFCQEVDVIATDPSEVLGKAAEVMPECLDDGVLDYEAHGHDTTVDLVCDLEADQVGL